MTYTAGNFIYQITSIDTATLGQSKVIGVVAAKKNKITKITIPDRADCKGYEISCRICHSNVYAMARRRIIIGGLNLHIITGHGEGGGGAGLVSQCYAACLNDPLIKDLAGLRCVCRNGDLNALHGAGDGCACGNGCRAAGDGNGVIPQGGDLGVLAALSMAAGAFLVLQAGLIQRRLLIHYPYPGMLGGFGVVWRKYLHRFHPCDRSERLQLR